MEDNDYNRIKSAEGLQNIGSSNPAEYRQKKKKRQSLKKENDQETELAENEMNESGTEDIGGKTVENKQDRHSVDYCA